MIRFINIGSATGNQDEGVDEFCFFCTITDRFEIINDECCWISKEEFALDCKEEGFSDGEIERYTSLIPDFNYTFYCQREIEGNTICSNQCEHCFEYYKPIENQY